MGNQYEGKLRAAILEAVKKPTGMLTADIKGFTVPQVGRMVQKLQKAHLVFRSPMRGKFGRYFDTITRAEAYANSFKGTPVPSITVKKSSTWDLAAPAILPPHIKIKRMPTPKPRFHVDTVEGGFSSLPPGVYALPATSCAAKAAGA